METHAFILKTLPVAILFGLVQACGDSVSTTAPPGGEPTCSDAVKNGDETDVDCGGACSACGVGQVCLSDSDCVGKLCIANVCAAAATCTDTIKNGTETDVDCGGGACVPCGVGSACQMDSDCADSLCIANVCTTAPTCSDAVKNGNETDVDCGGGTCPPCGIGNACQMGSDCIEGICNGNICEAAPTCSDAVKNGDETDIDCGGGTCPACDVGMACMQPSDCMSMLCTAGVCQSDLGTMNNPGTSCQSILAAGASTGDGIYWITADGVTFQVQCDMTRDGGGWTLMLRGRKSNAAGWGTTSASNLADLHDLAATNSSKAADAAINAVLSLGYRVETSNCAGSAVASTAYFKSDCMYQHDVDTAGACQTFYPTVDFMNPTNGEQLGSYKALSSYTTATRLTTSVIVHDPVSGAGNDSWWSGGPNACHVDVWVK